MFDFEHCSLENVWPWILIMWKCLTLNIDYLEMFDFEHCLPRNVWPWTLFLWKYWPWTLLTWNWKCLTLNLVYLEMFSLEPCLQFLTLNHVILWTLFTWKCLTLNHVLLWTSFTWKCLTGTVLNPAHSSEAKWGAIGASIMIISPNICWNSGVSLFTLIINFNVKSYGQKMKIFQEKSNTIELFYEVQCWNDLTSFSASAG